MKTVYTGGTFDLFHPGHVRLLKTCREISEGGKVVVSLNTDEFVERYKCRRPVMSLQERSEVIESCRYVDLVIVNFGCEDSRPAIRRIDPDVIVIGDSWSRCEYFHQMKFDDTWLRYHKIDLVFTPYSGGVSTTEIRERVNEDRRDLPNIQTVACAEHSCDVESPDLQEQVPHHS